jgi:hypothetical protein
VAPKRTAPQSGITNRPPEHAFVAAWRLETADAASTRAALELLRRVEQDELRSNLDEQTPTTPKETQRRARRPASSASATATTAPT